MGVGVDYDWFLCGSPSSVTSVELIPEIEPTVCLGSSSTIVRCNEMSIAQPYGEWALVRSVGGKWDQDYVGKGSRLANFC